MKHIQKPQASRCTHLKSPNSLPLSQSTTYSETILFPRRDYVLLIIVGKTINHVLRIASAENKIPLNLGERKKKPRESFILTSWRVSSHINITYLIVKTYVITQHRLKRIPPASLPHADNKFVVKLITTHSQSISFYNSISVSVQVNNTF